MLKKLVPAVFMVVMLCSVAYAKDYVAMVAPSGEEVSVYNTAVGEYLGMGYAISEKENESVWMRTGEGFGKLVEFYALVDVQSGEILRRWYKGAITNGKMLYYTDEADSSLYEMNLETGEERRLTTAWCEFPYELRTFMVYDGKVYVTDQYYDYNNRWDSDKIDAYGGIYSYNMNTGEYRAENINIQLAPMIHHSEFDNGFLLSYDSKLVYFSYGLCVYDVATGAKTTVSENYIHDCSFKNGRLYFLEESIYYNTPYVSCYDMNTGAKWVVCNLEPVSYWDAVVTDSYVAYTSGYEDFGAYVHYYVEDKPRLLTISPKGAYFDIDMKNGCLYLLQSVVGDVWNIYTYKDGILEYYDNIMMDHFYYMYDGKNIRIF